MDKDRTLAEKLAAGGSPHHQATHHHEKSFDLYMVGSDLTADEFRKIVRCGVERYGERFIPSLGVLNDGEGDVSYFISPELLRRNLQIVRESGVSEVWLFGSTGLNDETIAMLHDTLPMPTLEPPK